jgi:hypothetical protein
MSDNQRTSLLFFILWTINKAKWRLHILTHSIYSTNYKYGTTFCHYSFPFHALWTHRTRWKFISLFCTITLVLHYSQLSSGLCFYYSRCVLQQFMRNCTFPCEFIDTTFVTVSPKCKILGALCGTNNIML